MKRLLLLLLLTAPLLRAQDVLFMRSGEKRSGKLATLDAAQFRLQVPLPPPPGTPAGAAPIFASVSIPRADVEYIEFGSDPESTALIKSPQGQKLADVEISWNKSAPWLSIPRSPTARIGNLLGDLLLKSGEPAQATRALDLFKKIEAEAWSPPDKMAARQGRLRAMVATGNAKDAVNEAIELAAITESPAVLIEAKYILATAADSSLRELLEKNPRWEEDIHVIPERHRLYHESLDLYLYPSLFAGSESEAAARGLWGAAGIYLLAGESQNALECARDIAVLYPGTKAARAATDFIASLPDAQKAIDPEKEARAEQSLGTPDSKAADKSTEEKPTKKPYEKNKSKKS
ncbi:MAG: hypothetical protein ACOYM3_05265 [Terrimicrobiaceae bacterium]